MPANDATYQRDYMRQYRAAGRERTSKRQSVSLSRKFVGCDGEGRTLDNGYHAYFLLRVGEKVLRTRGGNARLTTVECLDFITSLSPDVIYIGYFFDYDVTKILEDLPFGKMQRLINRSQRTGINGVLFPLDYLDYQIEYLPRKEFKVRKKLSTVGDVTTWSPWIVINDVGSFFQCSFLKAIKDWKIGTEDEWTSIEKGKEQRAHFDVISDVDVERYNALEIKLLQWLMEEFRKACIKTGYIPSRWQGPGLLAESMMRGNGVPKSRDIPILNSSDYMALVLCAISAYYGGRSEIAVVGPINTPVWQKDINSAYPYAMLVVPCLLHGEWTLHEGPEDILSDILKACNRPNGQQREQYALCFGTFHGNETRTLWYGYPMRTHTGTIVYPQNGQGWYWSFEIQSAIHQVFKPAQLWLYTRKCECRPLAFVEEVYKQRQAIGKDGPGIVLKLGMNSLYGKTVQSIGRPKYSNPIWGSFITAYPRMMIQDFIHSSPRCKEGKCGNDILMIATDSVATTIDRTDYPDSKALGGWSTDVHRDGMFIVQPGVYFGTAVDSDGQKKRSKTRGVPLAYIEDREDLFRARFAEMVRTGDINIGNLQVPQKLFCGLRYAVHRHNVKLAGQWLEFGEGSDKGKTISFDWTSKRAPFPALAPTQERSYIQTFPYEGSTKICTIPYSKDIGGLLAREEQRMPFSDQPDWTLDESEEE